jgi:predicted Rossmann fold flavoprotein
MKIGVTWDVIVIGGGPAGMIAAGRAAETKHRVLLLEKNEKLGTKLLLTGNGRCNLTNAKPTTRDFLIQLKQGGKFLFSPFSQFDIQETLKFFHKLGLETKEENENRIFPTTDKAQSVLDALITYMRKEGVVIKTGSEVIGFGKEKGNLASVKLKNGNTFFGKSFILATGGTSHPETGSTGEGFAWLKRMGHTIHEPNPMLVPIMTEDRWTRRVEGITLPHVKISALQRDKKIFTRAGKILFTEVGVSGPTIINMSKDIHELMKYGPVQISVDTTPTLDEGALNKKLQEIFHTEPKKQIKNSLKPFIPAGLTPIILELSHIPLETLNCEVKKDQRTALANTLKSLKMTVKGLLGAKKAIVAGGGVDMKEIDMKTMKSLIIPNLSLVGDVLDIERPSGGYSLQICWTTGYVAGTHAPKK